MKGENNKELKQINLILGNSIVFKNDIMASGRYPDPSRKVIIQITSF